MKHWPSQLFPVVLLALLAGLTFVLQNVVDRNEVPREQKKQHHRDAIAENFSILRFDENGQIKYRLVAPYMEHFPDDDSSVITSPTMVSYRSNAEPLTISSGHAKATAKHDVTFLWDNVILHRAATASQSAMTAYMPDLTVQSEAGFAFTSSPVEITQGTSWLKGTGMQLDNNNATFVLQSQVTGLYFRPKATP